MGNSEVGVGVAEGEREGEGVEEGGRGVGVLVGGSVAVGEEVAVEARVGVEEERGVGLRLAGGVLSGVGAHPIRPANASPKKPTSQKVFLSNMPRF
jgi:hypothetical protein